MKFACVHSVLASGINIAQILVWIEQYGLPLLLQVLPLIVPFLGHTPTGMVVAWIAAALQALKDGQPLPPLPA